MDFDLQQAAEQEAQQAAEQQPDNQPSEKPDEPETLQEAMFGGGGEEPPEPEADAPQEPEPDKDGAAAKPDEKAEAGDLAEPEGLGEKASARFQALANEVKEYRAKEGDYQQMAETVQEFQRLAQESCNNADQPPSGGCELKHAGNGTDRFSPRQPPSGGCELKLHR